MQRFKDGIGLRSSSDEVLVGGPKVKVSRVLGLNEDIKDRLLKALLILLLAGATMDDVKAATGKEMDLNSSEVPKGAELSGELVCLLLGLGAMVIYKLISEVGMAVIRRIVAGEETQPELKVKLLDEKAVEPSRGSDEAAGYDMATCRDFVLQPGESRLVSTRSTWAVVEVIFSYSEVKQVISKISQTYLKLFHFKKCLFLTSV